MANPSSKVTYDLLCKAAKDQITTAQAAERFNVTQSTIRYRCGIYGVVLAGMKPRNGKNIRLDLIEKERLGTRKKEPGPKPEPLPELFPDSPPTPALIALAEFDSIARKALARKRGERVPQDDFTSRGEWQERGALRPSRKLSSL